MVIEGDGDGIICCGWLHNGIKHEIQIDRVIPTPGSEPASLAEKITRQNFSATVSELGGCAIEGFFAITRQGKFILHIINNFEPNKNTTIEKQLVLPLWKFSHSDVAFESTGRLIVTLSQGLAEFRKKN